VDIDAGGAEGEEAFRIFTEIYDQLLGVEGAGLGFVDGLFAHRNRNYSLNYNLKVG
jgi:hypothetical protein